MRSVESAQQMYTACMEVFPQVDIAVKAAAVADYTPASYQPGKIKKGEDMKRLWCGRHDILQNLGAKNRSRYW